MDIGEFEREITVVPTIIPESVPEKEIEPEEVIEIEKAA